MKKTSIILIRSLIICLFCVISISVAPVINNLLDNFTTWGKLNCELYSDIAEYSSTINTHFENQKLKNLCRRQNAMYSLEYAAFIINIFIAAILAQMTLIHYFDKGYGFEKTTGLIGFIGGIVTFILMLVYVCFSGYIFTQDVAYKVVSTYEPYGKAINKLYSNGASTKNNGDGTCETKKNLMVLVRKVTEEIGEVFANKMDQAKKELKEKENEENYVCVKFYEDEIDRYFGVVNDIDELKRRIIYSLEETYIKN